jgi:hypothetical protein
MLDLHAELLLARGMTRRECHEIHQESHCRVHLRHLTYVMLSEQILVGLRTSGVLAGNDPRRAVT